VLQLSLISFVLADIWSLAAGSLVQNYGPDRAPRRLRADFAATIKSAALVSLWATRSLFLPATATWA